jgi:hypothetical protein
MIGQRFGHYRILRHLGETRATKMIKELAGTKLDVDGDRVHLTCPLLSFT